jgi:hypothetical protein
MSDCVDDEGRPLEPLPAVPVIERPGRLEPGECLALFLKYDSWIMGNTTLYRADAVRAEGGLKAETGPFADGLLQRVLALKHGVCFLPEPLAVWRRSPRGFATRTAAQADASLQVVRASAALMRGPYRDLFPEEYVRFWETRTVLETVRHLGRAHGEALEKLRAALPEPGPRASLFFRFAALLNAAERFAARAASASLSHWLARRRGRMS